MFKLKKISIVLASVLLSAHVAHAEKTLRVHTTVSQESPTGQLIQQFVKDVEAMSAGELKLDMYYSGAVVKPGETFDAAVNGVLDCDMSNGGYQTGKNPAFQFANDIMGGYDTPLQQLSWLYYGNGKEQINELYSDYNMTFVGWFTGGQESLTSTKPLANVDALKEFKFRSPPGMESEIFAELGAKPVVMDFTEIFTALETGIIDGADASNLANNVGLGIYDIAKYTTFPGFHSMAADHLACNTSVWNDLTDAQRAIVDVALQKMSMQTMLNTEQLNSKAAIELPTKGVELYDWSAEDRAAFRQAATKTWDVWAEKTPETKKLVESHKQYMKSIGLIK